MQEPIKQILFRFNSMRASELLSSESKSNYFIQHFDGITGHFFAAVDAMASNGNKKTILKTAAESFTDKKTKDEIIAFENDLYDFGLLIIKNRNKITYAEASAVVTGLTVYSNSSKKIIWENLFYQTITLESGYTREAILVMLLANHIVKNFGSIPATDEDIRKWANSRIVCPEVLFKIDENFTEVSTLDDLTTGEGILGKYLEAAEIKMELGILHKANLEVVDYIGAFIKTNNELEQTTIKAHTIAYETALKGATEIDVIDQFSGYTFKDLINFTEPVLNYIRPKEVEKSVMQQTFSSETNHLFEKENMFAAKTFAEMQNKLHVLETELNDKLFNNASFYNQKISVNGSLISKCAVENRLNKKYSYSVKMVEYDSDKYGVMLVVDVQDPCLFVELASSNATIPQNASYTTKKSNNAKGIITVDLTNGKSFSMSQATDLDMSGELLLNNGLKLNYSMEKITPTTIINGVMTVASTFEENNELEIPNGFGIKRLGISDFRRVEQTLCCYVPGEVAHIENVMAREYKERSTRRLRRSEETITNSSSYESENLSDTSTTSRFDMQSEISKVLSESKDKSRSANFNSSTSGSTSVPLVGEVDFTLGFDFSTDFSTTTSSELSENQSTSFAKDVTEKALQRITRKVSEERTSKIIEEFEEKNQHGFDNRKGAEHISGVFRWVDKIYKNEIHNYGKRLQYEFMVPQPAVFHLIAKAASANANNDFPLSKPLDPRSNSFGSLSPIVNSAHIKPSNYSQWAAIYGAIVVPPPKEIITVGKVLLKPDDGSSWEESKTVKDEILIPEGYGIDTIRYSAGGRTMVSWANYVVIVAGQMRKNLDQEFSNLWFASAYAFEDLNFVEGIIPVSAQFSGHRAGMVSITVKLRRKYDLLKEWQLDTYNAIINAYEEKVKDYKDALAELSAKRGIDMGDNPAFYRQIENTVLKKNCLTYLTGHGYLGQDFIVGKEIETNQVNRTQDMDKYTATVKFFEQAFEWDLMQYTFYPFYWAHKDKWEDLYAAENNDGLFRSFLRSGMARTVVTVRPGFEEAVMYYLATGLIWNGGEVPVIGDDLYLSIVDELNNPEFVLEETWESRVPSTLTLIQSKTIALEAEGLPCYCDTGNPPAEEIVEPVTNPLTGLDVHIDGETV